jgi:hypothetical protein
MCFVRISEQTATSPYNLTRRQMIGFLNWGGECLQRGTHWVFILDRMRFVSKGLMHEKSAV